MVLSEKPYYHQDISILEDISWYNGPVIRMSADNILGLNDTEVAAVPAVKHDRVFLVPCKKGLVQCTRVQ